MPLSGPPLEEPIDVRNVLARGLATKPDEVALASAEAGHTWRELDQASDRLAANMLALGVRRGDRVASLMPNRNALIIHYLACLKAGFAATPLNYRYMPPEIDHALEVSEPTVLLAHAERNQDLAASKLVARLPLGVIGYGGGQRHARELRGAAGADAAPAGDSGAFLVGPGRDLLHVRQHRQTEGRHPLVRDVGLAAGGVARGLRDDGG